MKRINLIKYQEPFDQIILFYSLLLKACFSSIFSMISKKTNNLNYIFELPMDPNGTDNVLCLIGTSHPLLLLKIVNLTRPMDVKIILT